MRGFFRDGDDDDRVPDVGLSPARIAAMEEQCKRLASDFRILRRRFGEYDEQHRSEPSMITRMLDERVMGQLEDIRGTLATLAVFYGRDDCYFRPGVHRCLGAPVRKTYRQYEKDKTRQRHENCPGVDDE